AVLRLITKSNRVGCSIGRAEGLLPFCIFLMKYAGRRDQLSIFKPEPIRPAASAYFFYAIEGRLFPTASPAIVLELSANSPSSVTATALTRLLTTASNAPTKSLGPLTLNTSTSNFRGGAAAVIAEMIGVLTGLAGLESAPT